MGLIPTSVSGGMILLLCSIKLVKTVPRSESWPKLVGSVPVAGFTHTHMILFSVILHICKSHNLFNYGFSSNYHSTFSSFWSTSVVTIDWLMITTIIRLNPHSRMHTMRLTYCTHVVLESGHMWGDMAWMIHWHQQSVCVRESESAWSFFVCQQSEWEWKSGAGCVGGSQS